jgi:hypothetical protein
MGAMGSITNQGMVTRPCPAKHGSMSGIVGRPVIGDAVERPRVGPPTLPLMASQSTHGDKEK